MKNLYEPAAAAEIKARLQSLRPDSQRQWGTMNVAQAVAHCAIGMEMALGDTRPKRMFIGRIIGPLIKWLAIRNDEPIRRNSPTAPDLVVAGERELERERERLSTLIDRFAAAGPAGCTTHPHSFFGRMTPQEWAVLSYKHLDHHLRQFGV
ncbi:MAG TPA: DUF1569 domain-containing protein [Longimicrobium sp.]|jgi:hypothetical protein|uniref:DUF1569 domain-containing protein n=1 Tax=Longimicrobium sp. TaxID=2029185 RepID=UPI002EDB2460